MQFLLQEGMVIYLMHGILPKPCQLYREMLTGHSLTQQQDQAMIREF